MQDYKSSTDDIQNKASGEENVYGYIPKKCDLKCYKCRRQGICVILRIFVEARNRSIRNYIFRTSLPEYKYRLNDFLPISFKKKLTRYLTNPKKRKLYNKDLLNY